MKLEIIKIIDYSFCNFDSDKMATLNIGTSSHHYIEEKERR